MDDNDKPDLLGFPHDEYVQAMLSWMDDDYSDFLVEVLYDGFRRQDPDVQILGLKVEDQPQFKNVIKNDLGTICEMEVVFKLQVMARDSQQQLWRIFASVLIVGDGLDHPGTAWVQTQVDIERDELVAS